MDYKNKIYKRELSIVGKKLFIIDNPTDKDSFDSENLISCKNCMEMKRGECIGKEICDFYKYSPIIDQDEIVELKKGSPGII